MNYSIEIFNNPLKINLQSMGDCDFQLIIK